MSHFLDRLRYFSNPKEPFSGDHGVTTGEDRTWEDVYRENERQWSHYNFEEAPVEVLTRRFGEFEAECRHLVERGLPLPAYDQVLKASHTFNLLDARGAISVTERAAYIARVRNLARSVAQLYLEAHAAAAA